MNENEIQQLIQIEASKHNITLMRNNSGALTDSTGRLVRYGLGNISEKSNKYLKSSDLIGIKEVVITQDMVGQKVGLFMAVEVKAEDWKYKASDREVAQKNFIDLIISKGGLGFFANSVEQFRKFILNK
jgi:hypothetical protein